MQIGQMSVTIADANKDSRIDNFNQYAAGRMEGCTMKYIATELTFFNNFILPCLFHPKG